MEANLTSNSKPATVSDHVTLETIDSINKSLEEIRDSFREDPYADLDHNAARLQDIARMLPSWLSGGVDALETPTSTYSTLIEDLADLLSRVGGVLSERGSGSGEAEDLRLAAVMSQLAIEYTPEDHSELPYRLSGHSINSSALFEFHGTESYIDDAIIAQRKAVELTPADDAYKQVYFDGLRDSLLLRFDSYGHKEDIDEAVTVQHSMIDLSEDDDTDKRKYLRSLADTLATRFEEYGNPTDIDEAIATARLAVQLADHDGADSDVPASLNMLGSTLHLRYVRFGEIKDLEDAISSLNRALNPSPTHRTDKPGWMNNLGVFLKLRYERLGELSDLEEAIHLQQRAVNLTPDDDEEKPGDLSNLGTSLETRFKRLGNRTDLDDAISAHRYAIKLSPEPKYLHNLGTTLRVRFERYGELANLEEAISEQRRAIDLLPGEDAMYLRNLGSSLQMRYERQGYISDLEDSIVAKRRAASLTPDDHPDKPLDLNNLGNALGSRFERSGNLKDIEECIATKRRAVELMLDEHPLKPASLFNLGDSLETRYTRYGDLVDLEESCKALRHAILLTPDGHVAKPMWLSGLGHSLLIRFQRLKDPADITGAIEAHRRSLDLTPEEHPDKIMYLNNYGTALRHRFGHSGDVADLESAIKSQRLAIELTPTDHLGKAICLDNLATSLLERFDQSHDPVDIDEAIVTQRLAVSLTPDGHLNKSSRLRQLGLAYGARLDLSPADATHFKLAYEAFMQAAQDSSGRPDHRLYAAVDCGRMCSDFSDLVESPTAALRAYERAIAALPLVVWLGQTVTRRYEELSTLRGFISEAAAAAIAVGELSLALEWLEEGRSVVWGQILRLRTPVVDLRERDEKLANRLEQVSAALESAGQRGVSVDFVRDSEDKPATTAFVPRRSSFEEEVQQHRLLAAEYEELLASIRALDGFSRFLLPKPFAELTPACKAGPVAMINVDESRCDAVILFHPGRVTHVALPDFSLALADSLFSNMRTSLHGRNSSRGAIVPARSENYMCEILELLWLRVVGPILEVIKSNVKNISADKPRVTWCLTGSLAFLPLHAAGIYNIKHPSRSTRVSDSIISSYTPSLSVLLKPCGTSQLPSSIPRILVVTQPTTPGDYNPLPQTLTEAEKIRQHFVSEVEHFSDRHATVDVVLAEMGRHEWVHLACHGIQHPEDPTKSAFALYDGELELASLMSKSFQSASLAVLSACQTATGDRNLPEEAVHLAAGMLATGYRSVLATMWSIADADGPIVADALYGLLRKSIDKKQPLDFVRAVDNAIEVLKDAIGEDKFERWIPFVHFGL